MPEQLQDPSVLTTAMAVIICLIAIYLIFKIIKMPFKWAFKLLIHAVGGFLALLAINFVGYHFGLNLYIPITWISVLVVGILGIPGVVLILLFNLFF